MPKISIRVVCVNGKDPLIARLVIQLLSFHCWWTFVFFSQALSSCAIMPDSKTIIVGSWDNKMWVFVKFILHHTSLNGFIVVFFTYIKIVCVASGVICAEGLSMNRTRENDFCHWSERATQLILRQDFCFFYMNVDTFTLLSMEEL